MFGRVEVTGISVWLFWFVAEKEIGRREIEWAREGEENERVESMKAVKERLQDRRGASGDRKEKK